MEWNRRQFLAVTGGASVLAGCAAEPIEEETDDDSVDDDADDGADDDDDVGDDADDEDVDDGDGDDEGGDDADEEDDGAKEDDDTDENGSQPDEGDDEDGDDDDAEGTGDEDDGLGDADDDANADGEEADETDDEESDDTDDADDETADDEDDDDADDEPSEPALSDISIRVVDPDGEPIAGATVSGEGEPHEADIPLEFDGETGGSGYHHNTIYENTYTIQADHPDYEPTTVEHVHDGETELTVELEPVAEEPPVSEITISVVDPDGNPIEGAEIFGVGESHPVDIPLEFDGETDGEGVHRTPIYENEYTIEVSHPDYESTSIEHVHDGETEVEVVLDPGTHRLTIVAVDEDGNPVEDALVEVGETIDSTGMTDRSDENGEATFDVEAGEYGVAAMKGMTHTPVLVEEYIGTVTVEGDTTHEQEVAHVRDCAVTVRVLDPDGEPIEDAVVDIDIQPDEIWEYDTRNLGTDAEGEREVEAWCGEWTFWIRAEGYERIEEGRRIEDDSVEEFVLEPDGE